MGKIIYPIPIERPETRSLFEYNSNVSILLNTARYLHCGTKTQWVSWDSQLTFQVGSGGSNADSDDMVADTITYVYFDDSVIKDNGSIITAESLINKNTAPTWNSIKKKWMYSTTNDQFLFAILTTSGSTNIQPFFHDGGSYIKYAQHRATDIYGTDVDDVWTDCTLVTPIFGSYPKVEITYAAAYVTASGGKIYMRRNGSTLTEQMAVWMTVNNKTPVNSFTVYGDSSGKIEVVMTNATDSTLYIWTEGYYLPIGA